MESNLGLGVMASYCTESWCDRELLRAGCDGELLRTLCDVVLLRA